MERGQRTRGASSGDGVRVLREEYPYMLNSMTNLAATCWIQRRWNEAEELFIQVIEISESVGVRLSFHTDQYKCPRLHTEIQK
ncbi:uncharacterized protein K441DRAFT_284615 [Cenococcum geophilum 1.58]|uniref:uncharacterized protein n=1 Tax=Cenococcum geophilum 1.58 TaxID=794803 RepID=UPI00358EF8D5|nr:hypothetical protein K441DRAFT_284615 [Cenococcum geophilum 1.58]